VGVVREEPLAIEHIVGKSGKGRERDGLMVCHIVDL
jgi:hypothetical protein